MDRNILSHGNTKIIKHSASSFNDTRNWVNKNACTYQEKKCWSVITPKKTVLSSANRYN